MNELNAINNQGHFYLQNETKPVGESETSFELIEKESKLSESECDMDFEYPPDSVNGYSVDDLATHVANVVANKSKSPVLTSDIKSCRYNSANPEHYARGEKMDIFDGRSGLQTNCLLSNVDLIYKIKHEYRSLAKKEWKSETDVRMPMESIGCCRGHTQSFLCSSQPCLLFTSYFPYHKKRLHLNGAEDSDLMDFPSKFYPVNVIERKSIPQQQNTTAPQLENMLSIHYFQETRKLDEISCLAANTTSDDIDPEVYSNDSDYEFGDFEVFPPDLSQPVEDCVNESEHNIYHIDSHQSGVASVAAPIQHSVINGELSKEPLIHKNLLQINNALADAFTIDPNSSICEFPHNKSSLISSPDVFWDNASDYSAFIACQMLTKNTESSVFQYAWDNSFTYSMYLQTIGVDLCNSRQMLAFTGRLKLLEPTPISSMPPSIAITKPFDAGNISRSIPISSSSSLSSSNPHLVPIPEFDWSSSGLTNPFTSENSQKHQQTFDVDLEYFEKISSKPKTAPISELEAEFLKSDASLQMHCIVPPLFSNPLQQKLKEKKEAVDIKQVTPVSNCITQILSQLPDFSYMHKSTLAFPFVS